MSVFMELSQQAFNKSLSGAGEDTPTEHQPQQIPGSYPRPAESGSGQRDGVWRERESGGVEDTSEIYF